MSKPDPAKGVVCDLCGGTGYDWTWLTPNQYPTVKEAKAHDAPFFMDPEWGICDTCHRMVLAGKRDQLYYRAVMNVHPDQQIFLKAKPDGVWDVVDMDARAHIKAVHDAFWENKTTYAREP